MQYKLIKTYPGSPILNTVINTDTYVHGGQFLHCTDYPEFWEKVIEKEYEVLTVITNNGKFIETVYNQDAPFEPFWKIHSIKRLSDGIVFTIGDKITGTNAEHRVHPIISFKVHDIENTILITACSEDNRSGIYNLRLKNATKVKPPLFTTEDGIAIFEGDEYFELLTPDFHNKLCIWNILPNKTRSNVNYNQEGNKQNGRLWFSTKEAAEKYILMNKPCLSLKDVETAYFKGLNDSHKCFLYKVRELAGSRK